MMKLNPRVYIRIIIVLILLFFMYRSGLPVQFIVIIGVIIILLIILRGRLYRKIDALLKKHLKFLSKVPSWVEKLIIIIVFIIVYIAFRELVFFTLSLFGVDLHNIQNIVSQSVNSSMNISK